MLAAALVIWLVCTNIFVATTYYRVEYAELPEALDGFRIAQVSDFHNNDICGAGDAVVRAVQEYSPDIIAITGDLVDSKHINIDVSLELVRKLSEIAPCYYVTGNHEAWIEDEDLDKLLSGLAECGVAILRDEAAVFSAGSEELLIAGIDDPIISRGIYRLPEIVGQDERFTVLLSHRPEHYDVYKQSGVQMVLSGHAHGGQFRLPFIGGIYAPDQGFFPEYDGGVYQDGEFALVVSRGVGNSVVPVRFNNMPEVVLIELSRK